MMSKVAGIPRQVSKIGGRAGGVHHVNVNLRRITSGRIIRLTRFILALLILFALFTPVACSPERSPEPPADSQGSLEEVDPPRAAAPSPEEPRTEEEDAKITTEPGGTADSNGEETEVGSGLLRAHFIDVGQGDSILLETPSATVLIDGGPRSAGDTVVQYLVRRGIEHLDLVIGTHPHEDHIGGLIPVLQQFSVSTVIDAGVPHTTRTFDDYLSAIERAVESGGTDYQVPGGQRITLGDLTLRILGPNEDLGSLNDNSVVARVDYGDISFLFTGDAEAAAEEHLLRIGADVDVDVLKVAHHGSRTSTSVPFLREATPSLAIIGVGADNRYGHPTEEVLSRLAEAGVEVFRTDRHGTVVVQTCGRDISVHTEFDDDDTAREEGPAEGININTAEGRELERIVHVGPERAEEIIQLRPFPSVDALTRVHGIGPGRLQDIIEQGLAYAE